MLSQGTAPQGSERTLGVRLCLGRKKELVKPDRLTIIVACSSWSVGQGEGAKQLPRGENLSWGILKNILAQEKNQWSKPAEGLGRTSNGVYSAGKKGKRSLVRVNNWRPRKKH